MTHCPCCSNENYADCCEPYLTGKRRAPTPEALMRSRYTAFAKCKFDYLMKTMRDEAAEQFDMATVKRGALHTKWIKLEIKRLKKRGDWGLVEFNATFVFQNETSILHEVSEFERINGEWFYVRKREEH